MSTMIVEVYDAFKAAGASEEKAQAAATALASDQLATKSDVRRVEDRLAVVERDMAVLKWTQGVLIAGVAALILKAFFV